jgi:hypothetical protein
MQCELFEDQLLGYDDLRGPDRASVDAHVAACPGCREFLEALTCVDQGLAAMYTGVGSRRPLSKHRPLSTQEMRKPSAWPEVLDFCGWAAVVAAIVLLAVTLARQFGIPLTLPS